MKAIVSKKWIIGFASIFPLVLAKVSYAQTPAAVLFENADNLSALRDACGPESDMMEATYHAETRTVDLSDFDGCSTVVRLEASGSHSPNGE